ncbi:MFS transporter [Oxyplasma meridianum]|uniref:MFS transporter n=1 Tax=Oxyplasma meridianum TaxID=3073602 RepID=A0AAX4NIL9_9ARCH
MDEDHISRFMVIETIIVILSITFSIRTTNNLIMTSIPLLAKYDFKFSQTFVGILSALASASSFLTTALINARLSAKNRRISFVISNLLYTFILIGYWVSSNITIWMLTAAGGGLLGLIMPNIITSASLFKDSVLRERVLTLYTVFLSLSLISGPAIESYLLRFVSLKEVFLVFALFGILASAMSPFMHFPFEKRTGEKTDVLKNPGFRVALYNIMAYNIPFAILLAFAGIFEKDTFHTSLSIVSLLFSLFYLSSFLSRILLSIRPAKNVRTYMISAMGISLVGIVIMVLSNNIIIFVVALLVLGIPHGLTYPLSVLTISRAFGPQHRNAANSYFFSIMMLVGILLPLAGGVLVDTIGFRLTMTAITFIIAALLVLTTITFREWNAWIKTNANLE